MLPIFMRSRSMNPLGFACTRSWPRSTARWIVSTWVSMMMAARCSAIVSSVGGCVEWSMAQPESGHLDVARLDQPAQPLVFRRQKIGELRRIEIVGLDAEDLRLLLE